MKRMLRYKNKSESGQCGLEFIIGLVIIILIILAIVYAISKLVVLIQDNFRDMQEPTPTIPSTIETPFPTDIQSPEPVIEPTTPAQPTLIPEATPTPKSDGGVFWKVIALQIQKPLRIKIYQAQLEPV